MLMVFASHEKENDDDRDDMLAMSMMMGSNAIDDMPCL